jgi:Uri superfamily endonuclease
VEINEVWYSLDSIKREHQWADIFMGTHGVKLPIKGFGSSDCKCDSHLFFFDNPPSIKKFRKQIEQAISDHHQVEWIDKKALMGI